MRSTQRNDPVSIIERVSTILDCFTQLDTTIPLSELARRTGLPKATTWRLTRELVEHGFLEQHPAGFALGLRFFELGEAAVRPRSLRRLTRARMEHLRQQTGHTVHLAVLDGYDVVYIDILHSRTTPKLPSRVGGRVPAHATAVGKALLAFSRSEFADTIIARGLDPVGPRTITDPLALREALALVRAEGFAVEREESAPGVACVAVPVIVAPGEPVAAMSVSGPVDRLDVATTSLALLGTVRALRRDAERLPRALRSL